MKRITVTMRPEDKVTEGHILQDPMVRGFIFEGESVLASDGYHTFEELYDHRIALFIALCSVSSSWDEAEGCGPGSAWRSKLHSDGSSYEGWFILGIGKEKGEQITYHLPNDRWDEVSFAETLEKAPEFDGHTPKDVITRLKNL